MKMILFLILVLMGCDKDSNSGEVFRNDKTSPPENFEGDEDALGSTEEPYIFERTLKVKEEGYLYYIEPPYESWMFNEIDYFRIKPTSNLLSGLDSLKIARRSIVIYAVDENDQRVSETELIDYDFNEIEKRDGVIQVWFNGRSIVDYISSYRLDHPSQKRFFVAVVLFEMSKSEGKEEDKVNVQSVITVPVLYKEKSA